MDHVSVSRLLAVYALGACEPAEIDPIETHISQCPSCHDEAQPLKEVAAWLSVAPVAHPPASLRARLLQQAQNPANSTTGGWRMRTIGELFGDGQGRDGVAVAMDDQAARTGAHEVNRARVMRRSRRRCTARPGV